MDSNYVIWAQFLVCTVRQNLSQRFKCKSRDEQSSPVLSPATSPLPSDTVSCCTNLDHDHQNKSIYNLTNSNKICIFDILKSTWT
jgi:hypothetical protein